LGEVGVAPKPYKNPLLEGMARLQSSRAINKTPKRCAAFSAKALASLPNGR